MKTQHAVDQNTEPRLQVLIVGGYGTFGARLVECLHHDARLELIVAGRSFDKAKAFCIKRQTPDDKARLVPAVFDRDGDPSEQLEKLKPHVIVDVSGPFQRYGRSNDPYRLARYAIAHKINYLDIADAPEFVTQIAELNDKAASGGVYALSGASTCPALTSAVVQEISKDIPDIRCISAGIAPSPRAPLGQAVIRSICSYAGKNIPLRKNSENIATTALVDSLRHTIAIPGEIPLPPTHFTLVHVPELVLLPRKWSNLETVWFGAGPTPELFHRALSAFARLVHWGLLPNLSALAVPMSVFQKHVSWGDHRSGMFVQASGYDPNGQEKLSTWHLIAEGDVGPTIPVLGLAAIILQHLNGVRPPAGARSADHDLTLEHYLPLFEQRGIKTHVACVWDEKSELPLYEKLLQDRYVTLPTPLQNMHRIGKEKRASGQANVTGASTRFGGIIARLFGFPRAAKDIPVNVTFQHNRKRERWTRTFATQSFHSTQEVGHGRNDGLLVERFGPMSFGLALVVKGDQLHLEMQRWQILGLPMPRWAAPRISAFEHVDNEDRFRFSVCLALPIIGTLVEYRGWLIPQPNEGTEAPS